MTQEKTDTTKFQALSRKRTVEIRALINGLSEEKRSYKKIKNDKFGVRKKCDQAFINELSRKLYFLHLLYGIVRGKTFSELTQSFKKYNISEKYYAHKELVGLISYYFPYQFFDKTSLGLSNIEEQQKAREIEYKEKRKITPKDIDMWLKEKNVKLCWTSKASKPLIELVVNDCVQGSASTSYKSAQVQELRKIKKETLLSSLGCTVKNK